MNDDDGNMYISVKDRMPESMIKRMMDFARPEYGTPIGFMLVRGEMTRGQYSACLWFEDLYRGYRKAIDGPKGIRTSTGQRIDPGHAPDPFSPVGWDIAADEKNTVRAFDSARIAGLARGEGRFRAFWLVVIDGESPIGHHQKSAVAIVADALDKHRGLSSRHRRGRRKS